MFSAALTAFHLEIAAIFELNLFLSKQSSHIQETCNNAAKIHNLPLRLPRARQKPANPPSATTAFHPTCLFSPPSTINTKLPHLPSPIPRTIHSITITIRKCIAASSPPRNSPQTSSTPKTRIRNDVHLHTLQYTFHASGVEARVSSWECVDYVSGV